MALPDPIDPSTNPHLSGAFTPIQTEVTMRDLDVVAGQIPADLHGTYLRNGPNPRFTPLGSYVYPMEGDGMIHALTVEEGKASYQNSYVRTPMVVAEEKAGRALWPGMMTGVLPGPEDVGKDLAYTFRDMPAINVACHHGKLIALAETTRSYRFSPLLATLEAEDFGGAFPQGAAAHPKIDPLTGEMVTFTYNLEAPFLQWLVLNPDGSVKSGPTTVDVDKAFMVHDFAITQTKIVLSLNPAILDLSAMGTGGSLIQWRPELGSMIAVIPRDGRGTTHWHHGDAYWVWHFANAYDTDDGVDLQAVTWSNLGGGLAPGLAPATSAFERIYLRRGSTDIHHHTLSTRTMEFPRIDDRLIGQRHQQVALGARGTDHSLPSGTFDGVLTIDTHSGTETYFQSEGLALGEPCFVPSPASPTQGYYVTFATRIADMSSYFVILPSDNVASGPTAVIRMPQRVPEGLHGAWVPADSIAAVH